ncbi:polysaccharide deacetylase family protein [Roseateles sp. BYS78W]|uniref:Polysaccharide deacetylase family protein n=1 Tax=Pelomonas candidula TaxID=3299025 RepID=A0ABW7H6N7_9BURK
MPRVSYFLSLLSLAFACSAFAAGGGKRIAITIDDVPAASATAITPDETTRLNQALLAALKRHGAKAVGFVNEDRLLVPGHVDEGIAILDAWLTAGMELGNHNFGHLGLWQSSLEDVEAAVLKGEVLTRRAAEAHHAPLRYYRHPYTQTGRTEAEREAFETFLATHGYTVAPMTVEHDDYVFACVYDHLVAQRDDPGRQAVADDYDAHLRASVQVFETMSQELLGRQVPQILLIHASRLNADTLDRTLTTLTELGYSFVPLDEALRDEAYRLPARASGRFGPSWLARWARAQGVKLSVYGQPDPQGRTAQWHTQLCSH